MTDNWKIEKHIANLANLVQKFDSGFFPDQDFYEEYEWEILMMANEIANKQYETTDIKLLYDKIQIETYSKHKNTMKWEKETSVADAEKKTALELIDSTTWTKRWEAVTKQFTDILNNYRRFWEVIKSRLIRDMSDRKRSDLAMSTTASNISNELPF